MGFFGKNTANHNGFLNKIADPNPNGAGIFGSMKNWGKSNGGVFGWILNRNKGTQTNTNTTTNYQDNNRNNGGSW